MLIRPERPADIPHIRAVNLAAFGTSTEANLVDVLRGRADPFMSLVAEGGGVVVGHILFTPVALLEHPQVRIMGLAPMAVLPSRQRKGVGSALVRDGLERCRLSGVQAVVVLGHAEYYPRFGFIPASRAGLRCDYDVPDDVFMVFELDGGSLQGRPGTIRYHPAFADA